VLVGGVGPRSASITVAWSQTRIRVSSTATGGPPGWPGSGVADRRCRTRRPRSIHQPAQPAQQILGLGHGPQLRHGACHKLTIHRHPWSFARADTASAVGHRWSHPGPALATEPGTPVGLVGRGGAAASSLTTGSLGVAASGLTTCSGRLYRLGGRSRPRPCWCVPSANRRPTSPSADDSQVAQHHPPSSPAGFSSRRLLSSTWMRSLRTSPEIRRCSVIVCTCSRTRSRATTCLETTGSS
jgi:hypothetical protein